MAVPVSVATSIANFIPLEPFWISSALRTFLAIFRPAATVPMLGVETVIDVSVEVRRAVKPGSNSNEGAAMKPLGTVVSIRSAAIRGVRMPIGDASLPSEISYKDPNLGLLSCNSPTRPAATGQFMSHKPRRTVINLNLIENDVARTTIIKAELRFITPTFSRCPPLLAKSRRYCFQKTTLSRLIHT